MAFNRPTINQVAINASANLASVINTSGQWVGDPTGLQGATGSQGAQGVQGRQGVIGLTGNNGSPGPQGATGQTGTNGSQGAIGPQGQTGQTGTNGSQGATGLQGVQGRQGATGSGGLTGSGSASTLAYWTTTSNLAAGPTYSGGAIYASDFVISSDARLKDISGDISDPLDVVRMLRGVRYTWNETGRKYGKGNDPELGVIAQEVLNVLPEAVIEDPDGFLSVKYDRLVPVLIEAVKMLDHERRDMRAKLVYHEDRISRLERALGLK